MYFEGIGGPAGEGAHLGISVVPFGYHTLDAFFRLLLPRLSLFRHIVDHPGFKFSEMPLKTKTQMIIYLTSFTLETNPIIRDEKLREYSRQAVESLSKNPLPENWPDEHDASKEE